MNFVDPAGRVQLTLDPALPAECIICSLSANGLIQFVDFNRNFDYYGAVLICENCIKECLQVVENEKVANLELELSNTQEELGRVNDELNKYRSALDGLSFIRSDLVPSDLASSDESEDIGESDSEESGTDEFRVDSESDSDGPNSVGGLENVSIFANE